MDVLDYMVPTPAFMATSHLASKVAGVNPVYCHFEPEGWIWYIKGAKGFPWDGNFFDGNYVYQCVTENSWTDPTDYKAFASKSALSKHGGILWAPRQYVEGGPPLVSDSTYNTYAGGKIISTANLGGTVETTVNGPYALSMGALGVVNALVLNYFWGTNMEVNFYAEGYGLVRWQLWTLANSVWTLQTDNLFDQITPGGTPALNFPNPRP